MTGAMRTWQQYPIPMFLALGNTVWMLGVVLELPVPPFDLGLRENYGLFLGGLTSFFVTLGLARLGERAPLLKRRAMWLSLFAPLPIFAICFVLMSLDAAAALGLQWGADWPSHRALSNTMSMHIVMAGACAAFVLPYAVGRIDNDLFVYWTLRSFVAGVIGFVIAGLAVAAVNVLILLTEALFNSSGVSVSWNLVTVVIAFSLVWPWYALSDLPAIDRESIAAPPPTSKWFRSVTRFIALPFWLIGAVLLYLWIVPRVLTVSDQTSTDPDRVSIVAAVVVLCGLYTSICYIVALRDRAGSRIMATWRRWMGLGLLPAVLMALYALTRTPEEVDKGYILAFLTVVLVWLAFTAAVTIVRRDPRAPRLAFGFVLAMLAGLVAAPFLTGWFGVADPSASPRAEFRAPQQLTHYGEHGHEGMVRVARNVWVLETGGIYGSNAYSYILRYGPRTAAEPNETTISLRLRAEALEISLGTCTLARAGIEDLFDAFRERPVPPFLAGDDDLGFVLNVAGGTMGKREDGSRELSSLDDVVVSIERRRDGAFARRDCPEPLTLKPGSLD
ncbi:hypothetical protein [Minwuia sp.]|uniref:hypothetical protein n=1 Tax=Minwuia sp. TaxID=2493630 RepID=UPI003A954F46